MGAKVSAEMKHAIHLVTVEGKSPYEASRLAGVFASSIYKALKAQGKKRLHKGIDKSVS